MSARIYEFPSGRRLDTPPPRSDVATGFYRHKLEVAERDVRVFRKLLGMPVTEEPLEPSSDELSPSQRDAVWREIERHERIVENLRRSIGVLIPELGVPPVYVPGEGQLDIEHLNGEQQ